jgi:hypothetical protein
LAALGRFVRLWEPGLVYENPRLGDIRPFFFETAQWLRDNLGRRATPPVAHAIELTGPKEHHG